MKVSMIREDNMMVVDGVAREVDLSDLDSTIHAVQFDTAHNQGTIEYVPDAVEEVVERDFAEEVQAMENARKNNKRVLAEVKMKLVLRAKGNKELTNQSFVAPYLAKWNAAKPKE